jgi:hypothetical protein
VVRQGSATAAVLHQAKQVTVMRRW